MQARLLYQIALQPRADGISILLINLSSTMNIKRILVCDCIRSVQFTGTNVVMGFL